jgi:methionyl aminopeptidase
MHEEPQVLHVGKPNTGIVLQEGMVFTIEPMINQGSFKVKQKNDGWTVITKDRKLSAQWEHTILVTSSGYEVMTLRPEETL